MNASSSPTNLTSSSLSLLFPEDSELKKSEFTPNCLTNLLPLENKLADRKTRKVLILRKVSDWPLLCEDVAATTYYEAGYFSVAPPKLNIRAGPQPKRPDAIRDLESRAAGFCFKALLSLDTGFKLGGTDVSWPCYLLSDLQELTDPMKHIIPAKAKSPYATLVRSEVPPKVSSKALVPHGATKRPRSETSDADVKQLRNEITELKQQLKELKERPEPKLTSLGDTVDKLKEDVKLLKQHSTDETRCKLDLKTLEAGYERLLRAAYKEWREQLEEMKEKAAAVLQEYSASIRNIQARLDRLERRD